MSPLYTYDAVTATHRGPVIGGPPGEPPPAPPWSDPFVHRETKPSASNTGVGYYEDRDVPTINATGSTGVSYNSGSKVYTVASGITVENRVFHGFVDLGNNAYLRNCHIIGPPSEVTTVRALVQGPSTSGQATIEFCTIDPQTASAYYDGIGRGIFARRCHIMNVTDSVRAFSTSSNGARIRVEDCLLERMAQFSPDYVNTRGETHNDHIQFQGNPHGNNDDIVLDGCAVNARHSLTKGDIPPYRAEIAAVMMTPQNSVGAAHGKVIYCWLEGGMYCVNAGSNNALMSSSSLEVSDCKFERPGTDAYGDGRAPTWALGVDNSLNFIGVGNTYIDNGQPVPVTSA